MHVNWGSSNDKNCVLYSFCSLNSVRLKGVRHNCALNVVDNQIALAIDSTSKIIAWIYWPGFSNQKFAHRKKRGHDIWTVILLSAEILLKVHIKAGRNLITWFYCDTKEEEPTDVELSKQI